MPNLPTDVFTNLPEADVSARQKLFPPVPAPTVAVVVVPAEDAEAAELAGPPSGPPSPSSSPTSLRALAALSPTFASSPPPASAPAALSATHAGTSSEGRSLDCPLQLPLASAAYLCPAPFAAPAGSLPANPSRRVLEVALDVGGTPLAGAWAPGDALAVLAPNACDVVAGVLCALGVDGGARLDVRGAGVPPLPPPPAAPSARCKNAAAATRPLFFPPWLPGFPFPTARDVLTWCVELCAPPKRALLVLLGASCRDGGGGGDAATCSAQRQKDELFFLAGRGSGGLAAWTGVVEGQALTLLDLLHLFPAAKPELGALLSLLPPLAPRFYSIASSPLATPHCVRLMFNVVEFDAGWPGAGGLGEGGRIRRRGLATPWMEALAEPLLLGGGAAPPTLRAFLKPARAFAPPPSLATPLVMVAHGTGLAPFLSFVAHRGARRAAAARAAAAVARGEWRRGVRMEGLLDDGAEGAAAEAPGDSVLFFGNRAPGEDFYCEAELRAAKRDGVLTALHCAWSRAGGEKEYVQALLRGGSGGGGAEGRLGSGASLAKMLAGGGCVYVCGTNAMVAEVRKAVVAVLKEHGPAAGLPGAADGAAEDFVAELQRAGRYGEDKWG
jgi:sulfite reductase alpha subunit-like flavoprotein